MAEFPADSGVVQEGSHFYEIFFGPVFLGTLFGGLCYGSFLICAYLYSTLYPREPWLNKGVVAFLVLLNTFDTAIDWARLYLLTITNSGNLLYFYLMGDKPFEWLTIFSSAITSVTCQAFMAYRIVAFARAMKDTYNPHVQKAVAVLPYLMFGVWLSCAASAIAVPLMVSHLDTTYDLFYFKPKMWLLVSFFVMDLMITVILCLEVGLAKTGFGGSNAVLNALVSVILRNGFLVLGLQIAQLATLHTITAWALFCIPIVGKIQSITLIAFVTQPRIAQAKYFAKFSQHGGTTDLAAHPSQMASAGVNHGMLSITSHHQTNSGTYGVSTAVSHKCPNCGTQSAGTVTLNGTQTPKELSVTVLRRDDEVGANGMSFRAALAGLLEDDGSEGGDVETKSLREPPAAKLVQPPSLPRTPNILQRVTNSPSLGSMRVLDLEKGSR